MATQDSSSHGQLTQSNSILAKNVHCSLNSLLAPHPSVQTQKSSFGAWKWIQLENHPRVTKIPDCVWPPCVYSVCKTVGGVALVTATRQDHPDPLLALAFHGKSVSLAHTHTQLSKQKTIKVRTRPINWFSTKINL